MPNLNVHLDFSFEDLFKEIKFILKAKTNQEATEKIIDIAYKELKKEETSEKEE